MRSASTSPDRDIVRSCDRRRSAGVNERREPRPCLSVVIPCFNEVTTVETVVGAVLASPWTAEVLVVDDGSTDGTRDVLADARPTHRVRVLLQPATRARARPCGAASPRPRPTTCSCRTPTSSTTPASTRADPAAPRGPGRRRLRLAVHLERAPPRPLLLALGRQPVPHHAVEHVHQPEPHRHGDLLQGLPPRGDPVASRSRRTASASSPRSPPRWPAPGWRVYELGISYAAAPTTRARRSAGATACGPCGASSSTRAPAIGHSGWSVGHRHPPAGLPRRRHRPHDGAAGRRRVRAPRQRCARRQPPGGLTAPGTR